MSSEMGQYLQVKEQWPEHQVAVVEGVAKALL